MGMDFDINVNLKTIGKSDVESAEKSLEKILSYNGKTVTLNLKFNDGNGADFTKYFANIEKQAQSAGKSAGNSFQQGFKAVKFNGNSETFIKQYLEQIKKDSKEAESVAKKYDVSQKDALKAVNARNSAEIKSNNESIKERKRQQKEIEAIESSRIKASENAKKREEKLIQNQNNAINKSLESDYKQQQKNIEKRQQLISKQTELLDKNKKTLSSSLSNNTYANAKDIKEAKDLLQLMNTTDLNKYNEPAKRVQEIASQVSKVTSKLSETHKLNLDNLNKEIAAKEKANIQNLKYIQQGEESQKRIQVQQQIAAMKSNAVQKNSHYNSLVQQGKDNIARLKQEYEDQSKYLQKYESYKTKLDNLKSTVSKDSSLLGSSGYDKITSQINQAEQAIQRFNTELAKGNNANFDNLTSDLKEINSLTKKATTEYEKLSSKASAIDQQSFINKLNKYAEANPRAIKAGQAQWNEMFNSAQSASMTAGQLKDAELNLKQFDNEMQAAGKTGKNFFDEFKRGFIKIGEFAYTYGAIQGVFNNISSSINELKDINTIVTEISKAADVPVKQLKDLETNSFSVASKYGQKASDYLLGVQEMTRAGYSNTSGMAELSTLAQSAGDMTAELANQYLIASDMAFGYGGNVEKLNALLDSQNQINKMVC